jgi:redox-sensitive bicupin YhaK (pirin superfamily)
VSLLPSIDPACVSGAGASLELVVRARARDIGGFAVRRTLPAAQRRMVGPFAFFDHFGPVVLPPGEGMDVRPHPHIGLATLTYLHEGEILHRDSLGSAQVIRPGDVNWMLAGRGIVHSERTPSEARGRGGPVHGLQCWVALPLDGEDAAPRFDHHAAASLPAFDQPGARLRVLAGTAWGATSPVAVLSPTFYVDAALEAGARLPLPDEHAERAAYVVSGELACEEQRFVPGDMLVFRAGAPASVTAAAAARLILLGGAPLEGERHIWWNFVSSSLEKIEQAKLAWKTRGTTGGFPLVSGDEIEFVPLPER